ncbi:hypothetical protein HOY82DRAFT_650937 [Tuber indicum]|nr:hypothetical protein HOY82DRAFT_650937 [Tuber indicum]
MVVKIPNARDLVKVIITAAEKKHSSGYCLKTFKIMIAEEKEILFGLMEERIITREACPLLLRSRLNDPDTELVIWFRDESLREVLLELPTKKVIQVASAQYITVQSHGSPVINYRQRRSTSIEQYVNFDNAILNAKKELLISSEPRLETKGVPAYSATTIQFKIPPPAAMRSLVGIWAAESHIAKTKLHHARTVNDRKVIKVKATNKETQEKVLVGEEQPVSAHIFTGRGCQGQYMGIGLYNSSPIATGVWERTDRHFIDNYGHVSVENGRVKANERGGVEATGGGSLYKADLC